MINVLLATYNEAETISTTLKMVRSALKCLDIPHRIIVVDGNSPDGTSKVVKGLKYLDVHVVDEKCKAGLGASYVEGLKCCIHEYTVIMDADLQHDPFDIPRMFKRCREGYDVVVATRYSQTGQVSNRKFIRKLLSIGANNIGRYIIGLKTSDITGSYRCYRTEILQKLLMDATCKGFGIQPELIAMAEKMKCRISEVPITFHDRIAGDSKFGMREMYLFLMVIFYLYIKL